MTQPPVIMYSVNSFYSFLSTRALKLRWSSSLVRTNNHWWEARAKIWRLTFSIPSLLSLSVYWQKFLLILLPIKRCEWVGPSELLLTKVSTVWAEAESHHCRRGLNIWFHTRVESTSQKCGQFLNLVTRKSAGKKLMTNVVTSKVKVITLWENSSSKFSSCMLKAKTSIFLWDYLGMFFQFPKPFLY